MSRNVMTGSQDNSNTRSVTVGIIGCGWLGSALTTALKGENYSVVATTQHQENFAKIEALGAKAERLSFPLADGDGENIEVFHCHTLVICIPPGLRRGRVDYADNIAQIVDLAVAGDVDKIILVSTTAVYDGIIGNATESSPLKRDIKKVDILAQAEQHVLNFSRTSIVLRSAGLVGEDRHPGKFLRHRKLLSAPNAYVNLIHQNDIVAQLQGLIRSENVSGIFNAVSEMQVTKKHFYSIAASTLSLPEPEFDEHTEVELGKQVIGDKLKNCLNYQFQYGDLISWLLKSGK